MSRNALHQGVSQLSPTLNIMNITVHIQKIIFDPDIPTVGHAIGNIEAYGISGSMKFNLVRRGYDKSVPDAPWEFEDGTLCVEDARYTFILRPLPLSKEGVDWKGPVKWVNPDWKGPVDYGNFLPPGVQARQTKPRPMEQINFPTEQQMMPLCSEQIDSLIASVPHAETCPVRTLPEGATKVYYGVERFQADNEERIRVRCPHCNNASHSERYDECT